jgi:hypothetical protein
MLYVRRGCCREDDRPSASALVARHTLRAGGRETQNVYEQSRYVAENKGSLFLRSNRSLKIKGLTRESQEIADNNASNET